jgi:hypothetical protein
MKMPKNKNQPSPSQTLTGETPALSEDAAENIVALSKSRSLRNAFETETVVNESAAEKVQLISQARASFHEAAELADERDASDEKALEVAQKGGHLLFIGRVRGILPPVEVSTILGEEFGWKGKGAKAGQRVTTTEPDATRSATPFGMGEYIRKRIVRAYGAYAFVNGNEQAAGAFFKGLEPEAVEPLITPVVNGDGSIWTLYDKLTAVKQAAAGQRPKLAFDPKRIASITATLGENIPASVSQMRGTRGLFEAYQSLYRMLSVIGREMSRDEVEAA